MVTGRLKGVLVHAQGSGGTGQAHQVRPGTGCETWARSEDWGGFGEGKTHQAGPHRQMCRAGLDLEQILFLNWQFPHDCLSLFMRCLFQTFSCFLAEAFALLSVGLKCSFYSRL